MVKNRKNSTEKVLLKNDDKGNYTIKFQNQNPFFSGSTNFFDLKPVPFFKLGLPLSESALPFLNQDLPKIPEIRTTYLEGNFSVPKN